MHEKVGLEHMASPPNCHSVTGIGASVPSITVSQRVLSFQDRRPHLCFIVSVTLSHGISSQSFSIYCHSVTQDFSLAYIFPKVSVTVSPRIFFFFSVLVYISLFSFDEICV